MKRILSVPFLFLLACLICGVYGMLHNQVSYTVSPEYFTKFKFEQFNISPVIPDRFGAAIVGWHASWWMGIVIGFFIIPFGLLVRGTRNYIVAVLRAFGVVLCTAIFAGLVGLLIAYLAIDVDPNSELVIRGAKISNPAAFRRAGTMHNCSYLGGLIGIFTGMASILRFFLADNKRLENAAAKSQ